MELGNLSEIIGTIAVVASVVYLAQQVKKQTEEARLDASRDIASDFIELLRTVSENAELAETLPDGVSHYDGMKNSERPHQGLAGKYPAEVYTPSARE